MVQKYGQQYVDKVRNTRSEETASNKSSLSKKEQPNSAYKSPNSKLEPLIQEVTGESRNRRFVASTHWRVLPFISDPWRPGKIG